MPAVYSEAHDEPPDIHVWDPQGTRVDPGTACGIDPKKVVLAFFINGFYSTLFYNQAIGRLMRGGGIGKSYICLPEKGVRHDPPVNRLSPASDDEAKRGILSDVHCLNECMQAWLDGRPAKCIELCCEPCSVCRKHLDPFQAPPSQPDDFDDFDSSSPTGFEGQRAALLHASSPQATTQSGLAIQRYFSDQRDRTQSNQPGSFRNQTVQPRTGPSRLPAQPFVSCQQQAVSSAQTGSTANAAPGSASELSVAPNAIAGPSTSLGTSRPFNYTGNVQDWAEYQRGIQAGLERRQSRCPMCFMLRRPDNYSAGCLHRPRDFRKHESNDWSYGVACFFCHLPQDICKRRNSERTCVYAQYRDAVRGILMMLTAYPNMLRDASDVATVINPDYTIGEPDAPLRMDDEWRELTYYHNVPGYKAFQLVAAVLLLFASWR
ncbi:hypothetical protein V8E36_006266 [Tilletia maclaganii]